MPSISVNGVRMTPIGRKMTIGASVIDGEHDLGRLDDRDDALARLEPELPGRLGGDRRDDLVTAVDRRRRPRP